MRRFQPALLGGLFIGVLSGLPIVGAANYCCCLWVVVGGMLTVFLQQQNRPAGELDAAEAVLGGVIAGLAGAVLFVLINSIIFAVSGEEIQAQLRTALEENSQVPAELRDRVLALFAGPSVLLLVAAVTLPVYAGFSMLGALLGFALFRKKQATPPPAPR